MSFYCRLLLLIIGLFSCITLVAVAEEKPTTPTSAPTQLPAVSTTTTSMSTTTVSTTITAAVDTTKFGIITLRWRTESEQDNYGFNVYRSGLSKDSAFEKINHQIVRGNGTTSEPHDYIYIDRTAIKGKTYYYYLMDVDYSGNTKKFTPTISRYLSTDEEAKAEKEQKLAQKKGNPEKKKVNEPQLNIAKQTNTGKPGKFLFLTVIIYGLAVLFFG